MGEILKKWVTQINLVIALFRYWVNYRFYEGLGNVLVVSFFMMIVC